MKRTASRVAIPNAEKIVLRNASAVNFALPNYSNCFGDAWVRVLLVDNQPLLAEYIRRKLCHKTDIQLYYCCDVRQAVTMALDIRPTVILQSLTMSETDGLRMLKLYRAHPNTCDIPVLILSARNNPQIKAEAFVQGANDYIVKPPEPVEFVARLRYHSAAYLNLLQMREAARNLAMHNELLEQRVAKLAGELQELLVSSQNDSGEIASDGKLPDLDQMAMRIADDISNPISFIYNNLSPAERYAKDLIELLCLYQQEYPQPSVMIQIKSKTLNAEFLKEDFPKLLNSIKTGAQRIHDIVATLRHCHPPFQPLEGKREKSQGAPAEIQLPSSV